MKNVTILSSDRQLLRRFHFALELIGVETREVANIDDARNLDYHDTGVVFCDALIDGQTPFELVKALQAHLPATLHIKFIAITTDRELPQKRDSGPYAIFDGFLVLPFVRRHLYRRLMDVQFIHNPDLRENLLFSNIPEADIMTLLRTQFKGAHEITPAFDPLLIYGYHYPEVDAVLPGDYRDSINVLFQLHHKGLLDRRLLDRIHLCPKCAYYMVNFQETCPSCHSLDFQSTDIIHHFTCGYIGEFNEFCHQQDNSELICPKCNKSLRHIGMDYEKPAHIMKCRNCGANFSESAVRCFCLHCHNEFAPEQAVDYNIYAYRLSPSGSAALNRKNFSLNAVERQNDYPFSVSMEAFEILLRQNYFLATELNDTISVTIVTMTPHSEARIRKLLILINEIKELNMVFAVNESHAVVIQAFHVSETKQDSCIRQLQKLLQDDAEFQAVKVGFYIQKIRPDANWDGSMIMPRIYRDFHDHGPSNGEGVVHYEDGSH